VQIKGRNCPVSVLYKAKGLEREARHLLFSIHTHNGLKIMGTSENDRNRLLTIRILLVFYWVHINHHLMILRNIHMYVCVYTIYYFLHSQQFFTEALNRNVKSS